jgi:alpha-L-fucosidase 2
MSAGPITAASRRALLASAAGSTLLAHIPKASAQEQSPSALTLWYRQPAEAWTEALPIGNGRLGAMVFGGVARERLQLNDDTLWAGAPYDPVNPLALGALPEVRRLLFAERFAEANALAQQTMMARPLRQPSYQTVGDVTLRLAASGYCEDYYRALDLDAAIAATRYRQNGVLYTREAFVSPVDQVVVVRLSADRPQSMNFALAFQTPMPGAVSAEGQDTLILSGANTPWDGLPGGLRYEARAKLIADAGRVSRSGDELVVAGANSVTILIAAATTFKRFDDVSADPSAIAARQIEAAAAKSYAALRADHVREHQRLFRRVSLDLGSTSAAAQPTDARIRAGGDDPALAALYFHYARYLLICSSRPGSQPANLQGIWNDKLDAPWGSKYTININTEMNYWPAEPANLAECVAPLVQMVKDLAVTGARTAQLHYGARGWVAHHNTDLWRATAPIDGPLWGLWPTGGAWLCKHLWDHYDYGRDRAYLADVYPVMKGAAQFFLDTLVEEPTHGWLVTSPSLSPENVHPGGVSLCAGPAMDSQILRDLFANCIAAAETLGLDEDFRAEVAATRARLAPDQIGKAGQLQEWLADWDMEAPERDHRHVSHLYGLFPSDQINLEDTPALAAAARRSLELRGDLSTGWAIAWRINLWARLRQAEHAHGVLKLLLGPERTYPNMFDAHPPFQIDGNFGGANGVAEMLLQCVSGEILLLPALPPAWPSGSVRGLRARGGFELDISWDGGVLQSVRIVGAPGGEARLRYRGTSRRISVGRGRSRTLRGEGLN